MALAARGCSQGAAASSSLPALGSPHSHLCATSAASIRQRQKHLRLDKEEPGKFTHNVCRHCLSSDFQGCSTLKAPGQIWGVLLRRAVTGKALTLRAVSMPSLASATSALRCASSLKALPSSHVSLSPAQAYSLISTPGTRPHALPQAALQAFRMEMSQRKLQLFRHRLETVTAQRHWPAPKACVAAAALPQLLALILSQGNKDVSIILHTPKESITGSPMGPARATVRQPRRLLSSCMHSSAASRSRRAAASANFCSCALACVSFSFAAALHRCKQPVQRDALMQPLSCLSFPLFGHVWVAQVEQSTKARHLLRF